MQSHTAQTNVNPTPDQASRYKEAFSDARKFAEMYNGREASFQELMKKLASVEAVQQEIAGIAAGLGVDEQTEQRIHARIMQSLRPPNSLFDLIDIARHAVVHQIP